MFDVALEVPLSALAFGRLLQGDHPGTTRVEVLGEPLDGATLARGVTALEDDDEPTPGLLDPALQLQQFYLLEPLVQVVLPALHAPVVRVVLPPGVHGSSVRPDQHRIVVVRVVDAHP